MWSITSGKVKSSSNGIWIGTFSTIGSNIINILEKNLLSSDIVLCPKNFKKISKKLVNIT